jgi:hypothetical protein
MQCLDERYHEKCSLRIDRDARENDLSLSLILPKLWLPKARTPPTYNNLRSYAHNNMTTDIINPRVWQHAKKNNAHKCQDTRRGPNVGTFKKRHECLLIRAPAV